MNSKLKIVFLGTPDYVDPIIKTLEENFDLIKTIRSTLGFHLGGGKLNNEISEQLSNLKPDLFVVASFGKIIPQEILKLAKLGAINIHPSKLPLYRGPSPIQAQILNGVTDSAITFILMDSEMDHGPILHQEPFHILENDTFESLCEKMFGRSAELLPQVIKDFSGGKITSRLQNHATPLAGQAPLIASYCNLIIKEDGYFEIENPPDPEELDRMIRAYYPWPTAWTKWKGKIVKLLPKPFVIPSATEGSMEYKNRFLDVVTARNDNDKYLIQMEGKNVTDLKSFLNGYPDFPVPSLRS